MFRSYSDHLQGAHMFLVKVTDIILLIYYFILRIFILLYWVVASWVI